MIKKQEEDEAVKLKAAKEKAAKAKAKASMGACKKSRAVEAKKSK